MRGSLNVKNCDKHMRAYCSQKFADTMLLGQSSSHTRKRPHWILQLHGLGFGVRRREKLLATKHLPWSATNSKANAHHPYPSMCPHVDPASNATECAD